MNIGPQKSTSHYKWTAEFSILKSRFDEELNLFEYIIRQQVAALNQDNIEMSVNAF